MKKINLIIAGLLTATLGITACGKSNRVDTTRLEKAFASATGEAKSEVNVSIPALHNRDFATALPRLEKAFQNEELTTEQKFALSEAISKTALILDRSNAGKK